MRDVVQWTSPAPLWPAAAAAAGTAARRDSLVRPELLRFASDEFMDEFLALLERDPARVPEHVAQPETWRGQLATVAPSEAVARFALPLRRLRLAADRKKSAALAASGAAGGGPLVAGAAAGEAATATLKLYQPAHQRYYLLSACLVCGRAGLPDRTIDPGREERVTFVVRRLLPVRVFDTKTGQLVPFVNPQTGEVDQSIALPEFDAGWEEYAFVTTPEGKTGWRPVAAPATQTAAAQATTQATPQAAGKLVEGEEQLPLFPLSYTGDDGRRRRLLAGLVPVGKREAYMGAGYVRPGASQQGPASNGGAAASSNGTSSVPSDPRVVRLRLEVTEPWKRLVERADALRRTQYPDLWPPPAPAPAEEDNLTGDALTSAVKAAREQLQTGSWYVLLDFAKYLEENLPDVWDVILDPTPQAVASLGAATPARKLYDAILSAATDEWVRTQYVTPIYPNAKVKRNLAEALRAVVTEDADPTAERRLEDAVKSYDRAPASGQIDAAWPSFLFPLAHTEIDALKTHVTLGPMPVVAFQAESADELVTSLARISYFARLVEEALAAAAPPAPARPATPLPLASQKVLDSREGYFRLRCVYERPLCGPIDPPVVSQPTREFQMAAFFDPDAPARPIRIGLPLDTTPAGLRKFDKNTAFMISDVLCGQINRVKGLSLGDLVRSVLPWPLHKDLSVPDGGACKDGAGLQIGMICSLSLPIITICALLLLMIIVFLLDIIFRWVPYFMICFPLPGLKGKK
jgi:hypothetical protein